MGRVVSGGMEGLSSTKAQPISQQPAQAVEQSEETWPQYIGRNVAKIPSMAYTAASTGLGLGDLEHLMRTELAGDPEEWPNYVLGFKTSEQARRESRQAFPESWKDYATQSRPGDRPAEFLATELPMIAATGGFSSLPALGRSALQSAGILGGSEALGALGQEVGQTFGAPGTGRAIGSIAGGHAGGLAASKRLNILPTKAMAPEKIIQDLKEQQRPTYDAAIALEGPTLGNAKKLNATLNNVEQNIGLGMAKHDRDYLSDILNSVGSSIKNNGLTLEQAKSIKRNINDQLYEHTVSSPVKKQLTKIVGGLNDFILDNGSPEHNKVWLAAEKNTKDIKKFSDQVKHAKEHKESLPGVIKEGMNRWGLTAGLPSLAKWFGFSHSAAAITGLMTEGARKLFIEGKYLYKISKEHPDIFNKYINTMANAAKMDAPKVAIRVNDIAKSLDKYYPEESEEVSPVASKGRIVSGGLV